MVLVLLIALTFALAPVPGGTAVQPDPSDVVGLWKGTASAGEQRSDVGIEIRQLANGVGFFLTLPPLHAWRMPVGYLTSKPDGGWTIDDWHIALRRAGDRLIGELGDPRVTFVATRADALPAEPAEPAEPEPPSGPSPAWIYQTGARLWAGLAASGEMIVAADTAGTVHAIRAQSGESIWRARGEAPTYGAPAISGDSVFVLDDGGTLRRLARVDGREVWRVDLGGARPARVLPAATVFDFDFHAPSPVIDGGVVYITSPSGVVHAIDAADGRVRWRRDLKSRVRASVALSPARVFVGTLDNDVVALDRSTGADVWRTRLTGPVVSAATVAGPVVIVGSRGAWLSGLDEASGREIWARFQWISWVESTGTLVDGRYHVGSSDLRAVRAIEPSTGRAIWETDVLGWAWGTPAVTADRVYVGVAGPQKYVTRHAAGLVALDRKTGRIVWRRPVPPYATEFVSGYPGSVVVVGDVLVAPNVSGAIEGYRR
ncbi:MAG TPA: PQQ-binding-like beta-propeller repeat protein [Vicinamibacterales bacterium]|nr:PQQ-binding-like beta-propeller repeat protein [Vicinamibacterales bacterium]